MTKLVKVGFLGAGGMANAHAQVLSKIDGVKVSSCADVDVSRARRFVKTFGGSPYQSVEEMERSEELDAIYVCTPPYSRGVERIFVEKGVPTFFEKPVALDMRKAEPYMEEDLVFIDVVRTGDMSRVRSTFEDAMKTLRLTLAANEASTLKRAVEV